MMAVAAKRNAKTIDALKSKENKSSGNRKFLIGYSFPISNIRERLQTCPAQESGDWSPWVCVCQVLGT